ncbi:hypothetical protein L7F22_034176 [Adiantum nelumboides]|nr:hypothetical protein [Adiantum nelumboides]
MESPSYSSPASPAASLSSSSSSTLYSPAFSSSAAMAEHQAQAASSVARCSVLCGDIVLPPSLITLSSLSSLKIKCQPDLPRQLVDVVICLDKGSDASNRIGSEYIHVIIPYVAFSHSLNSQIQLLYPKNAIVTLPGLSASELDSRILYRPRSNDYPYFIAEAGPCELQVLSFFPDSEIAYSKSSAIDALNLSKRGDFYFRNKYYGAAAQLYDFSIEKASACVAACLLSGGRIRDVDVLVSAHCRRAECFVQLGMLIEAYDHCNKALDLDRHHFKSAFQRAKALHQMQEYSAAFTALAGCAGMRSDRSDNIDRAEIVGALRRFQTFHEQSAGRGEYGEMLKKFFMNDANWSSDLECSDYLGPVEIRLTGDGRGRGLFATKDLEEGSLVLVSNAMAMARWLSPEDDCNCLEDDVVTKLVQRCMRCKEDLEGLYALQGSGSEQRERRDVPSMSLFGPNKLAAAARARHVEDIQDILMRIRADSQQQPKVDAKRIKGIVNCTAYKSNTALIQQSNDITNERTVNSELFCGLWLLPGFINHSCIANLSRLDVGESAFFHATRQIKAGDELTVCYTDVHSPWALFRKQHIIRTFGFECNCRRCAVEAAYDDKLRPIVSDVYTEANLQLAKERDPDAQRALAGLAAQIEVVIRDASPEEKDIIRAAYVVAYRTYYKMQATTSRGAAEEVDDDDAGGAYHYTGAPPRKGVFARALRLCVPGDHRTITYLADLDQRPGWTDFCSWIGNDCARIHGVNAQVLRLMEEEKWPWQRRLEKQLRERREPLENQRWGQSGNIAKLKFAGTIRALWHRTCTILAEMLSY